MALFGWTSEMVTSDKVVTMGTLSGTGALWIIALFLKKFRNAPIYMSKPTWLNHNNIFTSAGLEVREYTYYNPETRSLDFNGMLNDLSNAQPGSTILLHTCAHNPTGVDLTQDQWHQLAIVIRENHLYPFFDTAYQGFASGCLE